MTQGTVQAFRGHPPLRGLSALGRLSRLEQAPTRMGLGAARVAKDALVKLLGRPAWLAGIGLGGNDKDGWEVRVMLHTDGFGIRKLIPGAINGVPVVVTLMSPAVAQAQVACRICSCGAQLGGQPRARDVLVVMGGCARCKTRRAELPPMAFPGMWSAIVGEELRPYVNAIGRGKPLSALGYSVATQQQMRQAVLDAWPQVFPGQTPSLGAVQAVQSIACHESSYGAGWGAAGVGSWNMGAVQCKCSPSGGQCCAGCFIYTDSRPTAQGQVKYQWCYAQYASPADGMAGILKILKHMPGVLRALPCGNLDEICWKMREAHYFEGFSTDHRVAARSYAKALDTCAKNIAAALSEPQAAARMGEQYTDTDGCPPGNNPQPGPDGGGGGDDAADEGFSLVDDGLPVLGAAAAAWLLLKTFAPAALGRFA